MIKFCLCLPIFPVWGNITLQGLDSNHINCFIQMLDLDSVTQCRHPGNPDFLRFGDLEIQNFGIQKIKKMKSLKNQIRSAQNVGKVWISRKKSSRPYLGPSQAIFSMDRKIQKRYICLPIFLGGPMGPIHPVWGPCCYPPEVGQ